MRAVRNTDDGIRIVNADDPTGEGVRLSVAAAGICGTDVSFVAAGVTGFIYGHEFAGVDENGTAYFVEPTIYGRACEECRSGSTQRCTEPGHGSLGIFSDGGMAEAVVVPEYTLLPLPAQLDLRDACLIEPGSVAWHGVRQARVSPDERLLVVGGGLIFYGRDDLRTRVTCSSRALCSRLRPSTGGGDSTSGSTWSLSLHHGRATGAGCRVIVDGCWRLESSQAQDGGVGWDWKRLAGWPVDWGCWR
jgi:hypothetical protein